jgi:hypothetical protein
VDQGYTDELLAALEQAFDIRRHGRPSNLLRVPRRLTWLLWLLAELDRGPRRVTRVRTHKKC